MKSLRNTAYKALRKSESFFKTDMVYLAKGGFWLNGGQALTALASFGLALLFARLVSKEVYGNYKYILSLAGLAATFSLTGLSTVVLQSVSRGFHGTFTTSIKVLAKWNTLIFTIAISGGIYYLSKGNSTLGYGLVIVALLYPVIRTFELYKSYLNGKRDFRHSSIYRAIVDISTIIFTAVALFFTDNVIILIAVNLLVQFILNTLFFLIIYKSIPKEDRVVEPGIIEFGKHLSFQNVMTNTAAHIDKVLIFQYLGAAEVAIYTFATAIPQQIKGLVANAVLLITPKLSQRTTEEAVSAIKKRFLLSLTVLIPIVVLYILFAHTIFEILFPAYISAVPYTQWYSLILLILGNLSGLVLTVQKAAKEQYAITIFASASQIILMLILIHPYGVLGVIWAILISKFMTAILSYIMAQNLVKD